ncbi:MULTISPECIES: LLM class F420-dependent oxidoreductase [unclassified Chelatococcus]|uniref:LLM class F420-dependent oxidoreductase n=1 Tax=unclassified Chelatococcus TaxID=2638111 RepID=UPI001BCFD585|nr:MULTISPECIES: LLM class F420-dependent oxidoreductase [unclassified Chelatococcus]MBS7696511.1 LLM class F420-dependent oxidoreductase [Chelatococcus sp. YT9]MBX3555077.1 LLM class F420-dependent oxidoreductase [Chelatococcus sp.]
MSIAARIRIAVQLQPVHCTYDALRAAVSRVDASGADILFNSDHFFPSIGEDNGSCFEAWTMLGAWAEQTHHVQLGVSVSGNTYRNAHLLADMARTVDHISRGRAILGIGSGWFRKDHDEYGYDLSDSKSRLEGLDQSLEAIRYRLPRLNPPPAGKLPIMIGNGGDRKPPEMVARYADIWMDFKAPEIVRAYNRELDSVCEAIGRDPRSIERGVAVSPEDLSRVQLFLDAGCTLFMVRTAGPELDLAFLPSWIAWRDALNDHYTVQESRQT